MRGQILANQKRLRVIPANAEQPPWPDSLPKWETPSADEKLADRLFVAQESDVLHGVQ